MTLKEICEQIKSLINRILTGHKELDEAISTSEQKLAPGYGFPHSGSVEIILNTL
jgi:hypothetical protein